jgi:hypothetical protein
VGRRPRPSGRSPFRSVKFRHGRRGRTSTNGVPLSYLSAVKVYELTALVWLEWEDAKHDAEDNLFGCNGSSWYCKCRQCCGHTRATRQHRQHGHKSCGRMRIGKLARPEWTLQFPGPCTHRARSLPGGILLGAIQPVLAQSPPLTSPGFNRVGLPLLLLCCLFERGGPSWGTSFDIRRRGLKPGCGHL